MRYDEIVGVENAEDIVAIPGSDWVITSACPDKVFPEPRTFFVNIRTRELRCAWPDNCRFDLDRDRFGEVEPPDATYFHGLDVIERGGAVEVYQVSHPIAHGPLVGKGREAIEVFDVDLGAGGPSLRWRGAVMAPAWAFNNDVCVSPAGGLAVTNSAFRGPEALAMSLSGRISGNVLEWSNRDEGWSIAEGTDLNCPNGIALAPGGDAYFIASWGVRKLVRVSRTDPHGSRASLSVGGMIDNITWTPDGALLLCLQCVDRQEFYSNIVTAGKSPGAFQAVRVDPVTLEVRVLVDEQRADFHATTALQVSEQEIWISSSHDSRLLTYRL